jgi:Predicted membrane protein (DUF2207)
MAVPLMASGDGSLFGPGSPVALPFGAVVTSVALIEIVLVAAALVAWLLLLAAVRTSTRPADVTPRPASADLAGDEPPAVVSLLANRWTLTEDAAESTLIDLAARGWLEFRQPGNDPSHTTVHLLPPPPDAAAHPLAPYEHQVLERVRHEMAGDVVPLTALTFRDPDDAKRWTARLHAAVIDDARARGLTRRRISPRLVALLVGAGSVPSAIAGIAYADRSRTPGAAGLGVVLFVLLAGLAGRPMGERDTPAGREAAARWLGLRSFLRNDEAFAQLPPSAVIVWDRYLSYGDALGVTRVCSALIDLGMGDRKRVWSSFGGTWHRVRIRYPRVWGRYGETASAILLRSVLVLVGGFLLIRSSDVLTTDLSGGVTNLADALPALVAFLAGRAVYRVARAGADLVAPRTLVGEVLWVELWKTRQQGEDKPSIPVVHYLAVDDGSGDSTTAWALPSEWSTRARPGDVVTIVVQPWTRLVTRLTVTDARADRRQPTAAAAPVPAPAPVPVPAQPVPVVPVVVAAAVAAGSAEGARRQLLTAQEAGAALGREVTSDGAAAQVQLGPFQLETFSDRESGVPVLVIAVARGSAGAIVMRGLRKGTPLTGIGDEAWSGPGWVAGARAGTMVRLNLGDGASVAPDVLPQLLATAVARI